MNTLNLNNYKACKCGNDVNSQKVSFKEKYTGIGWFFWSMGTTVTPTQLNFFCKDCNQEFLTITEKSLIKDYMLLRKK